MKKTTTIILQAVIGLIPVLYFLSVRDSLPESVPTHYNTKFEPDRFSTQSEFLGILLFIYFVATGMSILLNNINKIDPKRRFSENGKLMMKISWSITIMLVLLSSIMVYDASNFQSSGSNDISAKLFFALLALMFTALGNLINNVKPNYFVGIRTPWTLDDEENWRMTHHLGAKLWFFGGLIMFVLVMLLPRDYIAYVIAFTIIPMVVIPIIYSFYIFRQKKNGIHH